MAVEPLPADGISARRPEHPLNLSLRGTPANFSISTEEATVLEDISARLSYGKLIVWGYLLLLTAVIFVPLLSWGIIGAGKSAEFLSGLQTVRDFTTSMFAGLAGLSGLAGLVVGRHFPASRERPRKTQRDKKRAGLEKSV